MSKSTKVLWLITLTLSCIISSFAQSKITFVNKHIFSDEKTGIKELVAVNKQLEAEFTPQIEKFNNNLKAFQDYLLNCSKTRHCAGLEKRIAEQEKQNKEFIENFNIHLKKRKSEIIEPINKRISDKLKEFAKLKNYEKIFDLSDNELEDSALLYTDDPVDVTQEFIKFCNEEFEKEKTQKQ